MATVTLSELRTRARTRANMENSEFVSDTELNQFINDSLAELDDLLIASFGNDYRVSSTSPANTVAGTTSYALPSAFYKLLGVDVRSSSGDRWTSLRPFNFNERNRDTDDTLQALRYRLSGSNFILSQDPGVISYRLWYIPVLTPLTVDGSTYTDTQNFAEYAVVDAAIKCMEKEESDTTDLRNDKAALKRRIEEMAQNRDAGQPSSISDIYAEDSEWFWR